MEVENGAEETFEKIRDAFIEEYFMRGDETLEDAKKRLAEERSVCINAGR